MVKKLMKRILTGAVALIIAVVVLVFTDFGSESSIPPAADPVYSSSVQQESDTPQQETLPVTGEETEEDTIEQAGEKTEVPVSSEPLLDEDGAYTSKEDVALYIHLYGKLPSNFMTKNEARDLGWPGGSLEPYASGMCIGGDRFGNYEGLLPEAKGRTYKECDIDTLGADSRGAKRIVFSNDGLIYYTGDHYESFELLYGEE